jgi:hypothetical protein
MTPLTPRAKTGSEFERHDWLRELRVGDRSITSTRRSSRCQLPTRSVVLDAAPSLQRPPGCWCLAGLEWAQKYIERRRSAYVVADILTAALAGAVDKTPRSRSIACILPPPLARRFTHSTRTKYHTVPPRRVSTGQGSLSLI